MKTSITTKLTIEYNGYAAQVGGGGNVLANKPAGASNNKGNEHKRLQWACHCVVGGSGDGKVRERERV